MHGQDIGPRSLDGDVPGQVRQSAQQVDDVAGGFRQDTRIKGYGQRAGQRFGVLNGFTQTVGAAGIVQIQQRRHH